jgi:histidinol-phosphate aminotransferase
MLAAETVVARARDGVRDPELARPDWTTGIRRDPSLLWLDKNENTDPALSAVTRGILAELADLAPDSLYTYPESAALYAKIARWVGLSIDHFLLSAGSDGAIRAVFETFIDAGDTVVLTQPTFAMYPVYARMFGARIVSLPYRPSADGPELRAQDFISAIQSERPKLVCLPNPDSPTGTVLAQDALRSVVEAAGNAGAIVLLDEAYHPFYPWSAAAWVDENPQLIIARTFAKAWGLAGLRIGYAIAHPTVARLLHKVRPMYEVNTLAVVAMERMFDMTDAMEESVQRLIAGRDGFRAAMDRLGLRTLRSEGNFTHVAFGKSGDSVHAALADMVLYRRGFSEPCLVGFSRFSAATAAMFEPIIERITAVVRRGGVE